MVMIVTHCSCGKQTVQVLPRIHNGKRVEQKDAAFFAGIELHAHRGLKASKCSGSFIAKRWVITAAHCLYRREGVFIIPGLTEWATINYRVYSSSLFLHPHWVPSDLIPNSTDSSYDIGLVQLPDHFTHTVSPLSLPQIAEDVPFIDSDRKVTAYGLGINLEGTDGEVRVLRRASDFRISVSHSYIEHYLFCTAHFEVCMVSYPPHRSLMCQGDSGGPLVLQSRGTQVLAGITSKASLGCRSADPNPYTQLPYTAAALARRIKIAAVFRRVTVHVAWILHTIDRYPHDEGLETIMEDWMAHPVISSPHHP